ncbi:MAG: DMT family transporter [Paracoccaceae bacterium]
MTSTLKGALMALGGFALFSTHDAVVKVLGGSYSPFQILFFSVLFGFPLVMLMLIHDAERGTLRPVHPWLTLLRTVLGVSVAISAFTAFTILPLAQVYAILFAQPLLITALSVPVLGERVGPRRWAAVVAGLIGVLIVLRPGAEPLGLGHAAALVASLGGAGVAVILRKIGAEERAAVLILYPLIGNFVIAGACLLFVYQPMPGHHLALAALISVLGFVAMLLLIAAYRRAEAATVAPMQYSQILWAAGFGALFFDEWPDAWTMLGTAVIIASGVVIVMRESTGTTTRVRPVTTARSQRGDTVPGLRVNVLVNRKEADRD